MARFRHTDQVAAFTEAEYNEHLKHDAWTLHETQLLFELCRQFDLRFMVVHDRFLSAAQGLAQWRQPHRSLRQMQLPRLRTARPRCSSRSWFCA